MGGVGHLEQLGISCRFMIRLVDDRSNLTVGMIQEEILPSLRHLVSCNIHVPLVTHGLFSTALLVTQRVAPLFAVTVCLAFVEAIEPQCISILLVRQESFCDLKP